MPDTPVERAIAALREERKATAPAVPVVHPEPGDRPELLPDGVADFQLADALFPLLLLWLDEDDETVDEYTITRAAINHLRQRPPAEFALLFPSQVAAAVAAVRADLAAEVRAKAKHPPSDPGWVQAVNFVEGYNRALEDAAVLIRGVR